MELKVFLRVLIKYWWLVLLALVVTLGFTAWFTFSQEPVYESTASYIVRPTVLVGDAKELLDGLDVLGRQDVIAGTFVEMANSMHIKTLAAEKLGLSASQRKSLSVDAQLVSGTHLLKISVLGSDPDLVRPFADTVGSETVTFVQELYQTYQLTPLDAAGQPGLPVKPDKMLNLALGAALGLVLGAALAFLAYYLAPPTEVVTSYGVPTAVPASDTAGRGESGDEPVSVPLGLMEGERVRRLGRPILGRSTVGWIAAAVLTLVLIAGASAVWLSGRGTSAASLPPMTETAPLAVTATWTSTTTAPPTDMPLPTAMPSATAITEPSATLSVEPSATPITEPSATPITEPSATPTSEPLVTLSVEPSASSTSSATPAPTATPSPMPTNTPSPSPRPTQVSQAPARPTSTSTPLPAPVLLAPLDRQEFPASEEVVLTWQSLGQLPRDAYYVVSVAYSHLGEVWYDDVPWTRDTSWTLSEHSYLLDLSDGGEFRWSVQIVRQTGVDANGKPAGVPLSPQSEVRTVIWRIISGGGTSPGGPPNTPVVPPP